MPRNIGWRALIVVLVLAGAGALIFVREPRLGLDLRGGTQIVLEAQETARQPVDGDVVDRTIEVMRRRVDQLGVTEPTLQRSGDRRVIIELPGVTDPDDALEIIGRTAQLTFHPVLDVEPPELPVDPEPDDPEGEPLPEPEIGEEPPDPTGDEEIVLAAEDGTRLRLAPAVLTGDAISDAHGTFTELPAGWNVQVNFRGEGPRLFQELTAEAACNPLGTPQRRIAIVLDTDVISSPEVAGDVGCGQGIPGGTTIITGNFTQTSAGDLALLVRAGALPVPVEVVEQRTVGPTLGRAAIDSSFQAALIGGILTILFMIVYYRLMGLIAAVALVCYGAIAFAVLLAIGATLTLPGLAGFVLAIGMAVDANVLAYERIKEEHIGGRTFRASARQGFSHAFSAIIDSNATTLIAALLLYLFATGAVRGFGVTLSIGVIVSLFSALVVARLLMDLVARTRWSNNHPRPLGLTVGAGIRRWLSTSPFNIMARRRFWLAFSGLLVAVAIAGIGFRGINWGVEFTGGQFIEYSTEREADLDELRSRLATEGFPRAVVHETGEGNVAVRLGELTSEEEARLVAAVTEVGGRAEVMQSEFIGPTIGEEIRRRALIALGLALTAQLAYMAIRFRWNYGASAVTAMFHDVAILVGIFAWLGKQIDGVFLASLLTVIGYSINDSVVVFDRVREERRLRPKDTMETIANDAALQTLPRTINTGLGAMFILAALYVLGGDTLSDFALALLIGLGIGSYSSVFMAAPMLVGLEGDGRGRRPAGRGKVRRREPRGA